MRDEKLLLSRARASASCNIICNNFPPAAIRARSARTHSSYRPIRASTVRRRRCSCPTYADAWHVKKSREDNSYTKIVCCDIRPGAEVLLTPKTNERARACVCVCSFSHESNEYEMRDQFKRRIKCTRDPGKKEEKDSMHRPGSLSDRIRSQEGFHRTFEFSRFVVKGPFQNSYFDKMENCKFQLNYSYVKTKIFSSAIQFHMYERDYFFDERLVLFSTRCCAIIFPPCAPRIRRMCF